jgi:hypothetical protein
VETGRDLACPALWQESLERSLARRGRPTRSSLELSHLRPQRDLSRSDLLRESLAYSQLRRSAESRRPSMAVPGAGGISALALLAAATLPGSVGGGRGGNAVAVDHAVAADAATVDQTTPAAAPATEAAVAPVHPVAPAAPAELAHVVHVAPAHVAAAHVAAAHPPVPHKAASHPAAAAPARTARVSSISHSSHHSMRTLPPAKASGHVAADRDANGGAAHALSGGAAPAAPKLSTAAPRVPADPQPSGHPSTGGGAIEDASHPAVKTTPAHAPAPTTHPLTTAPATPHPVKATPHPVASTHPVAATHPAPKAPAPTAPPPAPGGYTNPLAGASVTPERIDQGVDYSGSGMLSAIGDGKVTYVGTSGTGWPGAFIEYQLSGGSYAGRYVYYAESISPAAGLHVGQTVRAGQPIASINGGIEIGWGSGVGTQPLAQALGQWSSGSDSSNVASPAGKSFSALVAQLGGPPGKVEG